MGASVPDHTACVGIPISILYSRLEGAGSHWATPLAVIFPVVGYLAGLCYCMLSRGNHTEYMVYLCYLCSGLLTAFFTKCLGIKSSGHAAGTVGPISVLTLHVSPWFALAYLLLIPVYWSSLKLKRHTLKELLWGTCYSIAVAVLIDILLP